MASSRGMERENLPYNSPRRLDTHYDDDSDPVFSSAEGLTLFTAALDPLQPPFPLQVSTIGGDDGVKDDPEGNNDNLIGTGVRLETDNSNTSYLGSVGVLTAAEESAPPPPPALTSHQAPTPEPSPSFGGSARQRMYSPLSFRHHSSQEVPHNIKPLECALFTEDADTLHTQSMRFCVGGGGGSRSQESDFPAPSSPCDGTGGVEGESQQAKTRGWKKVRSGIKITHRFNEIMDSAARYKHEPGWQLRMLTQSSSSSAALASGSEGAGEPTLSELSNALRSGIAQHLSDPDWLKKLHEFRANMERRAGRSSSVLMSDFRALLKTLFGASLGNKSLKRIFESLDSARQGFLDWRTVLNYMTPLSRGDMWKEHCGNVVTCIAVSGDCSVVGFGGIGGFVRAVDVATSQDLFRIKCTESVTAVALSSDASSFFVGKYKGVQNVGKVDSFSIKQRQRSREANGDKNDSGDNFVSGPTAGSSSSSSSSSSTGIGIGIGGVFLRCYAYPADVECVVLSKDDMLLGVGGHDRSVLLFHVSTGELLVKIPYPTIVKSVALSRPLSLTVNLAHSVLGSGPPGTPFHLGSNVLVFPPSHLQEESLSAMDSMYEEDTNTRNTVVSSLRVQRRPIMYAPMGPSADLLRSILTEGVGMSALETNLKHHVATVNEGAPTASPRAIPPTSGDGGGGADVVPGPDTCLFTGRGGISKEGAPSVAVMFVAKICSASSSSRSKRSCPDKKFDKQRRDKEKENDGKEQEGGRDESEDNDNADDANDDGDEDEVFMCVEDEEGFTYNVAISGDGSPGIGLQDWDSWLLRPADLGKDVVDSFTLDSGKNRRRRRRCPTPAGSTLRVGSKVVVAVASELACQTMRTVLAVGGDAGSVLIASFVTHHERHRLRPNQKKERGANIEKRVEEDTKRSTPPPAKYFGSSCESSRRTNKTVDELCEDGVVTSIGGGGMAAAGACARVLQSFLRRFDAEFGSHSELKEVCEVEMQATINAVSVSSDGRVAAAGGSGNVVYVLDTSHDSEEDTDYKGGGGGGGYDASAVEAGSGTAAAENTSSWKDYHGKHSNCKVIQRFRVSDMVFGVSLSGDGSRVAVGGADKKVVLLDVKTGCELFEALSADRIRCVVLSSKAHVVGFGGFDQKAQLCNTQRGMSMRAFPSPDVIHAVSVSADGSRLAMGGDDCRVEVFDVDSQECLRVWRHVKKVWAVALSGDGEVVCSGDYDSRVVLRSVSSGETLLEHLFAPKNGPAFVWSVALSFDASVVVAGSWNGDVRVWQKLPQTETAQEVPEVENPPAEGEKPTYLELKLAKLKLKEDARGDATAASVDNEEEEDNAAILVRGDRVFSVALARGGRLLAVGDRAGRATVYRLPRTPKQVVVKKGQKTRRVRSALSKHLDVKYPNRIFSVSLSGDGSLFALGGVHKQVWLYSTITKNRLHVFKLPSVVWSVAFTAMPAMDGDGGGDAAETNPGGDVGKQRQGHEHESCDWSNQYALAMGGEDRVVSVWECCRGSSEEDEEQDSSSSSSSSSSTAATSSISASASAATDGEGDDCSDLEALYSHASSSPAGLRVPSSFKRLLRLTKSRDVNSIAFSADALCVASGNKVVVVGGLGGKQWSWRDRPDFECMAEMLSERDQAGISTVLSRFPSAANLCHPHSGEAIMQRAVRLHTNDVLAMVLGVSGTRVGFVQDRNHRTALLTSLLYEKRSATAMLLEAVSSQHVSTMPSSLAAVTDCFPLLSKVFPSLLLDLICKMPLEKEPEMLAFNGNGGGGGSSNDRGGSQATFAHLRDGDMLVKGSSQQTGPISLWKSICDDSSSLESGSGHGDNASLDATNTDKSARPNSWASSLSFSTSLSFHSPAPTAAPPSSSSSSLQLSPPRRVDSSSALAMGGGSHDEMGSRRDTFRKFAAQTPSVEKGPAKQSWWLGTRKRTMRMLVQGQGQSEQDGAKTAVLEDGGSSGGGGREGAVAVFDPRKGIWRVAQPKVPKALNLVIALDSPHWVAIVLVLAVTQVTIELAASGNQALLAVSYVISCVFIVEISLRLYCTRVLKKSVWPFFKSVFNCIDFFVVFLDVLVYVLVFASPPDDGDNNQSSSSSTPATLARFGRVLKFCRTTRLARTSRILRALKVFVVMKCCGVQFYGGAEYAHEHLDMLRELARDRSKRAEVSAFRVPFENFAGFYEDLDESPLHLVTTAAYKLQRLEVFNSPIMQATIDFKWKRFARTLFYAQFTYFLTFLLLVVTFGLLAARTSRNSPHRRQGNDFDDDDYSDGDGDGDGSGDYADAEYYPTLGSLSTSSEGRAALAIAPIVIGSCFMFLVNELQQLISIGASSYFTDNWNYLDLTGFGLEIVAVGAWLARANEEAIRGLLALSTLLLLIKTLYFARGFTKWGPLVRMFVTITEDMQPFLLILLIFVSSFGIAFVIFNANEATGAGKSDASSGSGIERGSILDAINFVANMAVFGEKNSYFSDGTVSFNLQQSPMNSFFFISVMVIVNIILLNLLIAIMAESYARVQKWEELEALYERSIIIIEMEQSMLPVARAAMKFYYHANQACEHCCSRLRRAFPWRRRRREQHIGSGSGSSSGGGSGSNSSGCRGSSGGAGASGVPAAPSPHTQPTTPSWQELVQAKQATNFPAWIHLLRAGAEVGEDGNDDGGLAEKGQDEGEEAEGVGRGQRHQQKEHKAHMEQVISQVKAENRKLMNRLDKLESLMLAANQKRAT